MSERRGWAVLAAEFVCAVALSAACNTIDAPDFLGQGRPPEYSLGGQTGSLVPGCGVAPLTAAGGQVPAGDTLAVLYTGDCPEAAAEQLALAGPGASGVMLELEPLERDGVFLIRVDRNLEAGDYQLALGTEMPSSIRLGDEAPAVPVQLGSLTALPTDACVDLLRFELTLDDAALAYAPLSRFDVSIDGDSEQLWVDYGALLIESNAEGSHGVLELPRCESSRCLHTGTHRLELRVHVAGEDLQPEPTAVSFDVQCPMPSDDSSRRDAGCSLPRSAVQWTLTPFLVLTSCLSWFALRRRTRRVAEPPPPPAEQH